jgi:hypothetical protein
VASDIGIGKGGWWQGSRYEDLIRRLIEMTAGRTRCLGIRRTSHRERVITQFGHDSAPVQTNWTHIELKEPIASFNQIV